MRPGSPHFSARSQGRQQILASEWFVCQVCEVNVPCHHGSDTSEIGRSEIQAVDLIVRMASSQWFDFFPWAFEAPLFIPVQRVR